jgi:hypothetical protein
MTESQSGSQKQVWGPGFVWFSEAGNTLTAHKVGILFLPWYNDRDAVNSLSPRYERRMSQSSRMSKERREGWIASGNGSCWLCSSL